MLLLLLLRFHRDLSTAFAGIGGAETAQGALRHVLEHFTAAPVSNPLNLWACEYFRDSQYELMMGPNSLACVFTEITDFIEHAFQDD